MRLSKEDIERTNEYINRDMKEQNSEDEEESDGENSKAR